MEIALKYYFKKYYGSRIKSDISHKKLGFGFGRGREELSGPAKEKLRIGWSFS